MLSAKHIKYKTLHDEKNREEMVWERKQKSGGEGGGGINPGKNCFLKRSPKQRNF